MLTLFLVLACGTPATADHVPAFVQETKADPVVEAPTVDWRTEYPDAVELTEENAAATLHDMCLVAGLDEPTCAKAKLPDTMQETARLLSGLGHCSCRVDVTDDTITVSHCGTAFSREEKWWVSTEPPEVDHAQKDAESGWVFVEPPHPYEACDTVKAQLQGVPAPEPTPE